MNSNVLATLFAVFWKRKWILLLSFSIASVLSFFYLNQSNIKYQYEVLITRPSEVTLDSDFKNELNKVSYYLSDVRNGNIFIPKGNLKNNNGAVARFYNPKHYFNVFRNKLEHLENNGMYKRNRNIDKITVVNIGPNKVKLTLVSSENSKERVFDYLDNIDDATRISISSEIKALLLQKFKYSQSRYAELEYVASQYKLAADNLLTVYDRLHKQANTDGISYLIVESGVRLNIGSTQYTKNRAALSHVLSRSGDLELGKINNKIELYKRDIKQLNLNSFVLYETDGVVSYKEISPFSNVALIIFLASLSLLFSMLLVLFIEQLSEKKGYRK